jgi:hypothetical protein
MVCTALRQGPPAKSISHEFKSRAALVPLLKDIKAEIERRKKADEIRGHSDVPAAKASVPRVTDGSFRSCECHGMADGKA